MINITEESILNTKHIIDNMENKTFHNHYHILYDICSNLNKDKIVYLEIGAFAGGSASLLSMHKRVNKIYSIDIGFPIDKNIAINNVNKFKHDNCQYEYIQGSSFDKKIVDYVFDTVKTVDILFIDGDHSYDAVINDFNNYSKMVNKDGFIIFDDYMDHIHSPGVRPAVDDIIKSLDKNNYEIIGSLKYDLLKNTNSPNLESSNEFIIKKL